MGQPVIQTSFNAGEWAPALNARVDLAKYHSGAALIRNFFVDYRGGATTRPGSKYVLPVKSLGARLIPFQASFTVSFMLEFGNEYIRFFSNGEPILETATSITAAAAGPPEVFTDTAHGYANGDWIFVGNAYYIVAGATTNTFTLTDLFSNAIATNPFTLPAAAQRIYEIASPYLINEVFGIKYAQDVNLLILCHPNHPPELLTEVATTNWTLAPISFTPTIGPITFTSAASTAAAGGDAVSYVITAVDVNGQESTPVEATLTNLALINTQWTNTLIWASPGSAAVSFNIYRTVISATNTIPSGVQFGFVGNATGVSFIDTVITPDFSQSPPVLQNPFSGSGVATLTLTTTGAGFSAIPNVVIAAPPPGGVTATAVCALALQALGIVNPGNSYSVGQLLFGPSGVILQVTNIGFPGAVTGLAIVNAGQITGGAVPSNPLPTSTMGAGGTGFTFTAVWEVASVTLVNPGSGYTSTPSVTFSGGSPTTNATATSTIGAASSGNPTVPGFVQQRSVFGGPVLSPSQINLSQPGSPFNFNVSNPTEDDDAIQETLTNTTLNSIKSFVGVAAGLLVFTDKGAWVINGGAAGAAIGATTITSNPQNYSGASDLPPILTQQDLLYVQSKNSIVRDLAFNFYLSSYVGNDISILSSHLFYGFQLLQWAWAEEPFKVVWAVRNDGIMLSLTFMKEQELVAWAHHDTQGSYTSVATITESTSIGNADAIYTIAQRTIQGQTVQYIERFVELTYPNDYKSSWQVDAGIGYNAAAATTFTGAQHLGGQVVTGVADGVVINFTMPVSGTFVFGSGGTTGLTAIPSASIVTVGLSFLPQIQTLRIDLGEPTVQGKRKKISAVTVRASQTLGLSIGSTFNTLTTMKDFALGNVGTMSNTRVTGLVTDDARTIIDPNWTVQGQYCIQQNNPYPASVLGIIPEIDVGDTPK